MKMFRYAAKRILRGGSLFLTLFLSAALAATLFSGILQGADAIGVEILDRTLDAAYVDIITTAAEKNITKTMYNDTDQLFADIEGVTNVEHSIRWVVFTRFPDDNVTWEIPVLAIPDDSLLYEGITGVEKLEYGKVYLDGMSKNVSRLLESDTLELTIYTHQPFSPPGWKTIRQNMSIGGTISTDKKTFLVGSGQYSKYIEDIISGTHNIDRRPEYSLLVMSEETLIDILKPIFDEQRRPNQDQYVDAMIFIDRHNIINPWDIRGSLNRLELIVTQINTNGARFFYTPKDYMSNLLQSVEVNSNSMKIQTILVVTPVFFTAWYLGMTISDIVLGLRRREIGLYFTRGLNHRQVFFMLLFEGLLVSLLATIIGVITGAALLPLIIPGKSITTLIRIISITTFGLTLIFTTLLTFLSLYRPTRKALDVSIVDALKEHQTQEESLGTWQEPLVALLLGSYRIVMLLLGLSVTQFEPDQPNIVISVLYNTWLGSDLLLAYIAPILFFWGFTKLFFMKSNWFFSLIEKITNFIIGASAKFSTVTAKRNLRKIASSVFMVSLIMGFAMTTVGTIASYNDYMRQISTTTVGADASVWLFEWEEAESFMETISNMDGISSVTIETFLKPETSLGEVPIRAITPMEWADTAFIPTGWMSNLNALEELDGNSSNCLLEKGAARQLELTVGESLVILASNELYVLKIVGLYGKEPGTLWRPLNPSMYIDASFLEGLSKNDIESKRLLVKFEPGADIYAFKEAVENISRNIERVDLTEEFIESSKANIYLNGPRKIEELGAYFAAIVASLGIVLITYTVLRSRVKEITIMSIRGYSPSQLNVSLIIENLSTTVFAILLGLVIGFISIYGQVELMNRFLPGLVARRIIFPAQAIVNMGVIIGLLLASTIIPIIMTVRRITEKPDLKLEE